MLGSSKQGKDFLASVGSWSVAAMLLRNKHRHNACCCFRQSLCFYCSRRYEPRYYNSYHFCSREPSERLSNICQRAFRILRVLYPKPLNHKEANTRTPSCLFLCGELRAGVSFHRMEEYLLTPLLPSHWHILPCLHYSKDRTAIHLQTKWMLSLLPSEGNVSLV